MHHRAKLSDADVIEMRNLRNERAWLWSYKALADHFGCSVWTARDIVTGRTRRDLANAETSFAALAGEVE